MKKTKKTASSAKPAKVRVRLEGGAVRYLPKGTTSGEALLRAGVRTDLPLVGARFDNKITSLQRPLDRSGLLEAVYPDSHDGSLIVRRGLTFVLIRAVQELFPDLRVHINHSLSTGYYAEVLSDKYGSSSATRLVDSDLQRIRARMKEIIAANDPFERLEVDVAQAIRMFRKAGMDDKVRLLRYREAGPVSVYRCGSMINHFYGQLPRTTGDVGPFELHPCPPGFVLVFPSHTAPTTMRGFDFQPKLFAVFQEYERWLQILGMRTIAQFNEIVDTNQVREYILIAEALHEKRLAGIADMITNNPRQPRIVLLSGPSASGKTTSLKRLAVQLRVNGHRPAMISLDDFFVPREKTPRDESGDYDFESFEAIDVPALQDVVSRLLSGEVVRMPKFDFKRGRSYPGEELQLFPGQILMLEGIHALNTWLLPTIPDGLKFRIYASPLTHPNIDDHNRISSSDTRLIRRIVRDYNFRGYSAGETLGRWPSVRRGEHKNIFPYQENADVVFNSSLPYEFSVLKKFALAAVAKVQRTDPLFSEAARLAKFLSYFREIDADLVPRHSLLREFIGGSSFKY